MVLLLLPRQTTLHSISAADHFPIDRNATYGDGRSRHSKWKGR